MASLLLPSVLAAVCLAAAVLVRWRKSAKRAKLDREQIDRKLKEEALDRALSNGSRQSVSAQAQSPMEVRYSAKTQAENGSMLRLTELAETTAKEYLFRRSETLFLGEQYGRPAVFRERGGNLVDCEIFPFQEDLYVRACGKGRKSRLLRGKQKALLTEKSACLRSGDKIETQSGVFLVEFI